MAETEEEGKEGKEEKEDNKEPTAPPEQEEKQQKHLILDVDNTLLDGFQARPFLTEFLHFCFTDARIGSVSIWTASQGWWEIALQQVIGPCLPVHAGFLFVWQRNRCLEQFDYETQEKYAIKPLKKVWKKFKPQLTKENTIIIDDCSLTFARNYGNSIHIKPFHASEDKESKDNELLQMMKRLDTDHLNRVDVRRRVNK